MKIFYAIQATGNGHVARALEILPFLKEYGKVDLFLSGSNSSLPIDVPVRYRSKGVSLHYHSGGGLHYKKIIREFSPLRIWKEASDLPVEKYDLVINDFEAITALACRKKGVPSLHFGHQASFQSPHVPRPFRQQWHGEWILKNYAPATSYAGLHFKAYDNFIHPPVIKEAIRAALPIELEHVAVYLSAYSLTKMLPVFHATPEIPFEVFSKEVEQAQQLKNVLVRPVNGRVFTERMITARAVITGAGFETPAEAMFLKKNLLVIPIRGQYEQYCNAAALEKIGVPCFQHLYELTPAQLRYWYYEGHHCTLPQDLTIPQLLKKVLVAHETYSSKGISSFPTILQPPVLNFN